MHQLVLVLVFVFLVFSWTTSAAGENQPFVHSYTMEEMYGMALSFRKIRQGEELEGIQEYMKAAEFRGYVAAVLDASSSQHNEISRCARRMPVNDIAYRTAVMMTSSELDRAALSPIYLNMAIQFACDESNWGSAP